MPILDNQVPIPGQSVTSYVVNHRTSPLCWMVTTSLLGGQTSSPQVAIQFRSHPIHGQCMPILHQFQVNPVPVRCQWGANLRSIFHSNPTWPICQLRPNRANSCQSMPILAIPMPISCHFREPFVPKGIPNPWTNRCQFQAITVNHLSL